jgi:hypothetical protein
MDGKVKSLNFHNIHDALKAAKATNYTREEHWSCTEEQAEAARKAAMKFNNTKYDTLSHNCWDMVCAAVNAAGGNCVRYSEIPNRSFDFNEDLSDGVSTADSWGD